jgi:ADP-ribose pyrophosphatase
LKRTVLHRGRIGEFGIDEVVLPNGREVRLEILRHPGAAAVVPSHDDGTVTLIRQHRHAAGGMIWEIPAGKLEPGESPVECAARELEEEAGLRAAVLHPLSAMLTTPAFTDEIIHLYLATGLTPVEARPEPDEILSVVRLPLEEAVAMVDRGEIVDGKTICGLMIAWLRRGR